MYLKEKIDKYNEKLEKVEDKLMDLAKDTAIEKIEKEFEQASLYSPVVNVCKSFQETSNLPENIILKIAINALVISNTNIMKDLEKYVLRFGSLNESPSRDFLGFRDGT
jgi:dynactin complex subunit